MQYCGGMKRALRFPLRWAGRSRPLLIAVALSAALGACDNTLFGARGGTMEYPGSGASPNVVPTYVVKNKDTVESIARRYGVSAQTIIDRNRLQAPYAIQPGQSLEVPGAKVVAPETTGDTQTAAASGPPSGPPAPVKKETLAPPPGSSQAEPPNPARPAPGEPTPLSPAAATAPSGPAPRFEWPVRGKIVQTYGTQGGQKSDGIDIATEKGAPVKAADGGTVVYSGNEVRGMGNLLLVSHANGYITAYGYNDELLVKKGDTVKKGQVIAKAGISGAAADPRLHFEVRHSGKTVDPVSVLPQ
jgi:murein DD-endopeptidase MepM/ murein hydrolase activator NlpD